MGSAKEKSKRAGKATKVTKMPRKTCCVSTKKCGRCPLRMLKEGTLPPGYTVKRRRLVRVEVVTGPKRGKQSAKKVA